MNNSPTLKKISDHLNISVSTVSRALKDHPDVSAETIRRVKELASLLEYEPNGFAVNLRKKKSETYAVLVPEIAGYFYHSFIQAIEEEARKKAFGVLIMQSKDDPAIEKENLRICRYNHVAGVFAAIPSRTEDLAPYQKTIDFGIPVVFFDKIPATGAFTTIRIADEACAALAAQKLSFSGKGRVLCMLGDARLSITRNREAGFLQEWQKYAAITPQIAYTTSEEDAFRYIMNLGTRNLTNLAIFCMSDEILCGVMRGLYKLQIPIPAEVSVLAMSNGFMPRYFNPQVSYIETSGFQLGKLSFEAMLHQSGDGKAVPLSNLLEGAYCPGGSL